MKKETKYIFDEQGMETESASKEIDVCSINSQGVFKRKYFYTHKLRDHCIGDEETRKYKK